MRLAKQLFEENIATAMTSVLHRAPILRHLSLCPWYAVALELASPLAGIDELRERCPQPDTLRSLKCKSHVLTNREELYKGPSPENLITENWHVAKLGTSQTVFISDPVWAQVSSKADKNVA